MRYRRLLVTLICCALSATAFGQIADPSIIRFDARHHPEVGFHGMVATQSRLASSVGAQILADGGNAVDSGRGSMGSLQTVGIQDGVFIGASDPRRPNAGSVAPLMQDGASPE